MGVIPPKMIDGTLFPETLVDLFGRLKVSFPVQQISASLWSSARDLFVSVGRVSGTGGVATYSPDAPVIAIAVGTTSSLWRVQSKVPATYQPGKPLLQFITGVLGIQTANTVQRFGYGFQSDRLYFQQDSNGLSVVLQSTITGSTVTTTISQADWNVDKLDRTGVSGFELDTTKSNIYVIAFEYLGVGDIVFGIVKERSLVVCHIIDNPNNITSTYIKSPAGFAFWENEQLAATGGTAQICRAICSSVQIEGSNDAIATKFPVSMPLGTTFNLGAANNYRPILFVRLRSGWQNTRVRFIGVDIEVGSGTYRVAICRNPTISGTYTPSWSTKTNSSVEFWANTSNALSVTDVPNTATWESGGSTARTGGGSSASMSIDSSDFIGTSFNETSDIFVVCVANSTANATVEILIAMLEQQI